MSILSLFSEEWIFKYKWVIRKYSVLAFITVGVLFVLYQEYHQYNLSLQGKLQPFSPPNFDSIAIAGEIGDYRCEHGTAEIFLNTTYFASHIQISFYPYPHYDRKESFFDVVKAGDSLWKPMFGDYIYTMGKDKKQQKWNFMKTDKYGRKYIIR